MVNRKIPATMATQHPDNASAPFWESDGDGFVSTHEELTECLSCFNDLAVDEFMWDWEGKYADEAVIDKLFYNYFDFFKKNQLGKNKFLTFRLPNVWQEKGYSLIRALMVILTAEDMALDLKFSRAPLFEVILPMTERPDQLIYIQKCFQKLAHFKNKTFKHSKGLNRDYLEMIPLIESVEGQMAIQPFLEHYLELHKKQFRKPPKYLRPFFARSDPAEVSGLLATVLANKIGLSEAYRFSAKHKIPVFPILGAGSLIFRGGLNPDNIDNFLHEYSGIQSAYRYDYPLNRVKRSINKIAKKLPSLTHQTIPGFKRRPLAEIVISSAKYYQNAMAQIISDLGPIFNAVPVRRERKLHVGLLSYKRKVGDLHLPRAINFTSAFYSLGAPPEFIGLGRFLKTLKNKELDLVSEYYLNFRKDIDVAGRYLNLDNLRGLAAGKPGWQKILDDIYLTEKILGVKLGPKTKEEKEHKNLTAKVWLSKKQPKILNQLIAQTGKIRKSLG